MPDMLERRLVDMQGIEGIRGAWSELAARAARSPFEVPGWLLSWLGHYGSQGRPFLLTWWLSGDLVGVAPLVSHSRVLRGIRLRELEFWGRTGTPLSGWVDVLADAAWREEVTTDFGEWLAHSSDDWDLFHFLHLAHGSQTDAALASSPRCWRVDLTRILHSQEYVLVLPQDDADQQGRLGPKARHEIRRQIRLFQRRMDGSFEVVTDPGMAEPIMAAVTAISAERWGEHDAYFRRDDAFAEFLADALRSLLEARAGTALVARDAQGIQACLIMLLSPPAAVAAVMAVNPAPEYRPLSLGKCLFSRAIEVAAARGCRSLSFLTEGGYKESFWHAAARPVESGFVARGRSGLAVAALVSARRVLPAALRGQLRREGRFRP
jgi:CelD/BcsL family acetyltransferase involved in cellulose biosynthesis